MFTVLILVCSVNLTPADCQMNTARNVFNGPDAVNELACAFQGQAYAAATGSIHLKQGEYLKITCTRTSIGKTVG